MKYMYYALLGLLLGAQGLSAVDAATFDKIIELYKKNEVTRKDVINGYDQLSDKRLGDQLLQVFLCTTINELRAEEANNPQQISIPIPAPANRGRAECIGQGCAARGPRRQPRGPNSRKRRRTRGNQEQRDIELAKRRSIETAQQELEQEEIETAKALSLVDAAEADLQLAQDIETAKALSLSAVNEPEDRELAIALAESRKTVPAKKTYTAATRETSTEDIIKRAEHAQQSEKELPVRGTPAKRPSVAQPAKEEATNRQKTAEESKSKEDILAAARMANEGQEPRKQKKVHWEDQQEESQRSAEEIIAMAEQAQAPQQQKSSEPVRRQFVSLDDIIGSQPQEEPEPVTTSENRASTEQAHQEEQPTQSRADENWAASQRCAVM